MAGRPDTSKKRGGTAGRGGPGTFAGVNYQTLIGIHEAAVRLNQLLLNPWADKLVAVEPRSKGPNGQVSYDIGLPGQRLQQEVKKNPTRDDVRAFVDAVRDDGANDTTSYSFVHGRASKAASDLNEVARIAREAGDAEHFAALADDASDDQKELIERLGKDAFALALRISTEDRPEAEVRRTIQSVTDITYGQGPAQHVREHLAVRFSAAAEKRETIDLSQVAEELAKRGAVSRLGATADISALPEHVQDALVVLSILERPLPVMVLSAVTECPPAELTQALATFTETIEANGENLLQLSCRIGNVGAHHASLVRAATLRHLLELAKDRKRRPLALTQARNIARLADAVSKDDPALVAGVYPAAEKIFKTTGNLHLALEVSRLSLRASHHAPQGAHGVTDQQLRDRAQTMICGESWVLQRTGHYDEAERLATKSQELGERLGWDRNTAYCLKCRGRLRRMRAERETDPAIQSRLLDESEALLQAALEAFSAQADFGPHSAEVGDCYSLLARTLFVARKVNAAGRALAEAQERLESERGTKDWADARILEAEMLADEGDRRTASERLEEVLAEFDSGPDTDATEIAARALGLQGRVLRTSDAAASAAAHRRAGELFEVLEDSTRAAEQKWAAIMLDQSLPADLLDDLTDEPVTVQVAVAEIYARDTADSGKQVVGRRAALSASRRKQILSEARLESARHEAPWL